MSCGENATTPCRHVDLIAVKCSATSERIGRCCIIVNKQVETKQLRVRVYHTYVPPVEASETTQATVGRWTLKIEGIDAVAEQPTIVVSKQTIVVMANDVPKR